MGQADEQVEIKMRIMQGLAAPPPPQYSNYVQVTFTPEDFTIHFGYYGMPPLTEAPEGGIIEAVTEPVARITLPLNLMSNVIAVLQRQLSAYEQSFGDIPEHPNKPDWMKEDDQSG